MKHGQEKEILEKRGRIITHFAYIEGLVKRFVTSQYFGTPYHPICEDIFEDEYFSFGLLLKIFEKLINRKKVKFPINKLRRMGQLRNIVAHAIVEAKASGFSIEEISEIYFRHGGEEKNIEKVFDEYDDIKTEVHEILKEISKPLADIRIIPEHKGEKPI